MKGALADFRMHDGSRHFASLPEVWPFSRLRQHVEQLAGATVADYVSDDVTEMWLDFSFRGHSFTVNNQDGEYWFFVNEPECPDDVLVAVVDHCEALR